MSYPSLTIDWTNPLPNERLVYKTRVIEVFGTRILILVFSFLLLFTISFFTSIYLILLIPLIAFLILFPYFITPYDVILSDKRLILRKRYWFSGRFSSIRSVNLYYVESQKFFPRLKVIPLTIGFLIIESFSLLLIQYALTQIPPLPLFFEIIVFFTRLIGLPFQTDINNLIEIIYTPLLPIASIIGIFSLIVGILLVIFGLPYRTSFNLTLLSGHDLQINAGVPRKLTTYIYSVSRVKPVQKQTQFWDLDIPLLEGETIKRKAKIALVNQKTQFIGFLSLYLSLSSFTQLLAFVFKPTFISFVVFLIYLMNLIIIVIALRFAKRYRHIITTNERVIFQDEYSPASGLWGQRIYQFQDLTNNFIQGFQIENYSSISIITVLENIVLIVFLFLTVSIYNNYALLGIFLIIIIFFISRSYRITTSFKIMTVSGKNMVFSYEIPMVWKKLSDKINPENRLFNLLFYNLLSEKQLQQLCNSIRSIEKPQMSIDTTNNKNLTLEMFISKDEKILEKWTKMKPEPYHNTKIVLTILVAIIQLVVLGFKLPLSVKILFILIWGVVITFYIVSVILIINRTLIVTNYRVLYLYQRIPKFLSLMFGLLPVWKLTEVLKEHVEVIYHKIFVPKVKWSKTIFGIVIEILLSYVLLNADQIYNSSLLEDYLVNFLLVIAFFILLLTTITIIDELSKLIPRFGLKMVLKYGIIEIPYFYDKKSLNKIHDISKN